MSREVPSEDASVDTDVCAGHCFIAPPLVHCRALGCLCGGPPCSQPAARLQGQSMDHTAAPVRPVTVNSPGHDVCIARQHDRVGLQFLMFRF